MGVGRIFSRGGAKVGIFGFNPSKLKKQPALANNFKIRGGKALPFDAHAGMLLESHLLSVMVLALELNGWWKLFHSGIDPAKFAQGGMRLLVSPQMASCVDEWTQLRESAYTLRLKL